MRLVGSLKQKKEKGRSCQKATQVRRIFCCLWGWKSSKCRGCTWLRPQPGELNSHRYCVETNQPAPGAEGHLAQVSSASAGEGRLILPPQLGRAHGELVPLRSSHSTRASLGFTLGQSRVSLCLRGTLSSQSSLSAGNSVLGEMLPADLSPSSSAGLFWKAEAALAQAAPCSCAQQCLAATGSHRQPGEEREASHLSTAATGRPGIAPHGRTAHTHAHTHSQTHTSHPWDQG